MCTLRCQYANMCFKIAKTLSCTWRPIMDLLFASNFIRLYSSAREILSKNQVLGCMSAPWYHELAVYLVRQLHGRSSQNSLSPFNGLTATHASDAPQSLRPIQKGWMGQTALSPRLLLPMYTHTGHFMLVYLASFVSCDWSDEKLPSKLWWPCIGDVHDCDILQCWKFGFWLMSYKRTVQMYYTATFRRIRFWTEAKVKINSTTYFKDGYVVLQGRK